MDKREGIRAKALADLQHSGVLMLNGHFDYGNGYHGKAYLNPHQLFRQPSTIWRVEMVAGPATGGTLLAHTLAGLLDSRRSLSYPPCLFAPFHHSNGGFTLRDFYRSEIKGKRVLLADDVRNTGETFERCATLVKVAGGELLATAEIYDRMESVNQLDVPNFALAEYKAPENYLARECPLCKSGIPITRF
jgi:orotate phosphoribosyltransferase